MEKNPLALLYTKHHLKCYIQIKHHLKCYIKVLYTNVANFCFTPKHINYTLEITPILLIKNKNDFIKSNYHMQGKNCDDKFELQIKKTSLLY